MLLPPTLSTTCIFHVPAGFSPQKWTDTNFHLLKPASEVSSGRAVNNCEIVPIGKVRHVSFQGICCARANVHTYLLERRGQFRGLPSLGRRGSVSAQHAPRTWPCSPPLPRTRSCERLGPSECCLCCNEVELNFNFRPKLKRSVIIHQNLSGIWTCDLSCSGTVTKSLASRTKLVAFITPNPNLELYLSPTPLVCHPGFSSTVRDEEVWITKCWTSRHVKSGLYEGWKNRYCHWQIALILS